jgi:hypothetical protein
MSLGNRPLAFDIYAADAPNPASDTRLARIARPLKGSGLRVELFGLGGGVLVVDRNDAQCTAANFADGNYVDVVDTGLNKSLGGFFMPAGTATLLDATREKGGQTMTVKGFGTLSYMGMAEWLAAAYVAPGGGTGVGDATNSPRTDGQWHWPNNRYGSVLERAVLEAQDPDRPDAANPPIPAVVADFTYALDSAGDAFTSYSGDFTQAIGTNYIDTIADMIRLGLTVLMKPDFTLQCFQNDYGRDLHSASFAAGKVRWAAGVNIADETLARTLQPNVRVALLLVQGSSSDPATFVTVTDAGGKGEAFLNYGLSDDATVLTSAGNANLALRRAQTDIARFRIVPGTDDTAGYFTPSWPGDGGHFWLGDTVTIHSGTGEQDYNNQSIRVAAIEWSIDDVGTFDVFVELGSTFYNFEHDATIPAGTPGGGGCTCPVPAPACIDVTAPAPDASGYSSSGGYVDAALGAIADGDDSTYACVVFRGQGGHIILGWDTPVEITSYRLLQDGGYPPDPSLTRSGWRVYVSDYFDPLANDFGGGVGFPVTDPTWTEIENAESYKSTVDSTHSLGSPGAHKRWMWQSTVYDGGGPLQTCWGVAALEWTAGSPGGDPLCTAPFLWGSSYVPGPGGYYIPAGSTIKAPLLDELLDVNAPSPADGEALIWDATAGEWISAPAAPTFGTPAIVLGTAAAAGSIDEVIRRDATIVAFDATAPSTQAVGDAAATGSAAVAAHRDHKHAITNPLTTQDDLWVGGAAGAPSRLAKGSDGQVLTVDPVTHHLIYSTPAAAPAPTGHLLLSSTHAVPIVFDDILQASDGSDLIYASE